MKNRKTLMKRAGALVTALLLTLALAGCGAATTSSVSDASGGSQSASSSAAEEPSSASGELSAENESAEFTAKLTYINLDYIETGDESEGKLIRGVDQKVTASGSDERDRIEAVTQALRTVPSDLNREENAETAVNDNFVINFVKVSGSTAVVDLSGKNLENIGDMDAELFIYQVTDSILSTFSDIDGVRFTVDGINTDDLSGIDISSPFTKSMVTEFAGSSSHSESAEESSSESGGKVTEQSTGNSKSGASDSSGVVNDGETGSGSTTQDGVVNDQ